MHKEINKELEEEIEQAKTFLQYDNFIKQSIKDMQLEKINRFEQYTLFAHRLLAAFAAILLADLPTKTITLFLYEFVPEFLKPGVGIAVYFSLLYIFCKVFKKLGDWHIGLDMPLLKFIPGLAAFRKKYLLAQKNFRQFFVRPSTLEHIGLINQNVVPFLISTRQQILKHYDIEKSIKTRNRSYVMMWYCDFVSMYELAKKRYVRILENSSKNDKKEAIGNYKEIHSTIKNML